MTGVLLAIQFLAGVGLVGVGLWGLRALRQIYQELAWVQQDVQHRQLQSVLPDRQDRHTP